MNYKKLIYSIIMGALLGVVCIIGANLRYGSGLDTTYLISFWYNRVIIGLVIGLMPNAKRFWIGILRGALLGIVISFAFYSSTAFYDTTGFIAGIVYGIIIEIVNYFYFKE